MSDTTMTADHAGSSGQNEKLLFWACFLALIATAFGFIIRTKVISDWGAEFGLTKTQQGEIFGVGLWPFAISIVLFSLIIDRIGYGVAMVFAFVCHVASAIITINATGYWSLYLGTFIVALGNGTVEAVINPVVATLFPREKTKWLNILHAGWPGGLVLGGLLLIIFGDWHWQYKVGLILLPTVLYGLLMMGKKFPVQERVAAGVTYRDMLAEIGGAGALIVLLLIFGEVGRVLSVPGIYRITAAIVLAIVFGITVRSLGRPLFIFLLIIMIPLATTELGVDSWITPLMETQMKTLGLDALWVLVYTSLIMMILRFFAGPIVHKISPLGLLAASAVIAALGLFLFSKATGLAILGAATIYGVGKTFFWPTMLGVAAERFPKGGAMTLNTLGGVGMLGVGVVGAPLLGFFQDTGVSAQLESQNPALYKKVIADKKKEALVTSYLAVDPKKQAKIDLPVALYDTIEKIKQDSGKTGDELAGIIADNKDYQGTMRELYAQFVKKEDEKLPATFNTIREGVEKSSLVISSEEDYKPLKEESDQLKSITGAVQKETLATVALLPCGMLVCYLILIMYFKSQGGYTAEVLTGHLAEDEKFTGGTVGPGEG